MAKYYCRNCGTGIEMDWLKEEYTCSCCNKVMTRKDMIPYWTRDARINQLKAMHALMVEANDEFIYLTWIGLMPDEPNQEDFEDIAVDDEQYNECFDLFIKLIQKIGNRW